jgi:CelD/BcsL family acetyltransferase involved in cellulose biosynthesis
MPDMAGSTAKCPVTGLHMSLRPLDEGGAMAAAWSDLAKRSLTANIFYEPQFALPARLPFGDGVQLLAIHADQSPSAPLLGVWPFRLVRLRWGLPLPVLLGWTHPFAASGVPLIDRDRADAALTALYHLPSSFPGLPRRALMPLLPDQGAFADALGAVQGRLGLREARTEGHDRAILTPRANADTTAHLSSGSRSKLRQEYRRLEKDGPVTLRVVESVQELGPALETYLELEAKGWKGRAGTAIPSSPAETEFMRGVVRDLGVEGRARIDELRLGDRVIASSITYRNGQTAWYAKISFDEDFAKNSPGSQLVLKVTEAMNADPSLGFVDSCAPPLHPLMRRFWPERMDISNRLLELAGGDMLFPLAAKLEEQRPKARDYFHAAKRWLNDRRKPA